MLLERFLRYVRSVPRSRYLLLHGCYGRVNEEQYAMPHTHNGPVISAGYPATIVPVFIGMPHEYHMDIILVITW